MFNVTSQSKHRDFKGYRMLVAVEQILAAGLREGVNLHHGIQPVPCTTVDTEPVPCTTVDLCFVL